MGSTRSLARVATAKVLAKGCHVVAVAAHAAHSEREFRAFVFLTWLGHVRLHHLAAVLEREVEPDVVHSRSQASHKESVISVRESVRFRRSGSVGQQGRQNSDLYPMMSASR